MLQLTLLFGIILLDRPSDSASVIEAWLQLVVASYGVCLLVGTPVHLVLRWQNRCSLPTYLVATTAVVAVIAAAIGIFQLLLPASPEQNPHGFHLASRAGLAAMLLFEGAAVTGASIFWRVSVRQRDGQSSDVRPTTSAWGD
ncbi:hypothetical protein [Sphingomonas xinjiangensis]|uniref:hypothetical protein n=1 Tax=Sphingomonas xinjiangensis TaxID=643568 RepID=UPI001C84D3E7|nr:hypothetical protein [Sphingomonas xinjiangensis]